MSRYSITIVEDDKDVHQRLIELFEQHEAFMLLDTSATMVDGIAALKKYQPDILLTDLGLPDGSGVEIIKAIEKHHLDCEAIVLYGFQDDHRVFEALEAGARAYIFKYDKSQKITDAIISMAQGRSPISPIIGRLILQKFQQSRLELELPEALTARQVKILKLVSQGFSTDEISEKLDVSYDTVNTQIKDIYGKLQINSRFVTSQNLP